MVTSKDIAVFFVLGFSFNCSDDSDESPYIPSARINELSADSLLDLDIAMESVDWIEIKNISDETLELTNYYLTDDTTNLTKWKFPQSSVDVDGYTLVYLDDNEIIIGDLLSAPFSLDRDGDYLALVDPDGETIVDEQRPFPAQRYTVSYGVDESETDSVFRYFQAPTPGSKNIGQSYAAITQQVAPSQNRGFFDAPFELDLSSDDGSDIYFTTDGSVPSSDNSTLYESPLSISSTTILRTIAYKNDYLPASLASYSYIFYDDVLAQPDAPPNFPSEWQPEILADYGVDSSVSTREELIASLRHYPTLSLTMPMNDWFNPDIDPTIGGIYSNSVIARGFDWERAISAEFFDFNHGREAHREAGIRIFGNASRATTRGKHNMRLVFRKEYGDGKFKFPLFGDDESDESINGYLLRGGNGDSWIHPRDWVQDQALYIRDQFARTLHEQTGAFEVPQDHINLYINGLYWGLYHTIERIEATSMVSHLGGIEEDWDVVKSSGDGMQIVDGSLTSWEELQTLVTMVAQGERSFDELKAVLDIEHFADFLIVNFYGGNRDWDHNNFQAAKRRTGDDTWRFFQWDSEHVIREQEDDSTIKNNEGRITGIHQQLLPLPEYKAIFQERIDLLLTNNGILTPTRAAATFSEWAEKQRIPLVMESARWADYHRPGSPLLVNLEWQAEVDRMLQSYFPARTQTTLLQLQAQGFMSND